jgi:predicted small lipoprotein YifL
VTLSRSIMLAAALLLALAACADRNPLWTPSTPRNGAMQPVDPVYGTPVPGYPTINNN